MIKWLFRIVGVLLLLAVLALVVGYMRSDNVCPTDAAISGDTMRGAIQCVYGGPEIIEIADLAKPVPGDKELLIKVHSASVNPLDWHYLRGIPYLFRLAAGLRVPELTGVGVDYSGTVESVGKDVTRFAPGDEVFGGWGKIVH